MKHVINTRGFTLIETIIYIGLFSLIFSGIFVSIYPLFTGAQRLTQNIAIESESAFILSKIDYALSNTIIDPNGIIVSPPEGETASELIIQYAGTQRFRFAGNETNEFCSPPLLCNTLTLAKEDGGALPLNAQRVSIDNFTVTHVAKSGSARRYIDVTFTANDEPIGPVRYYLNF
jgi:hypothetical protein